MAMPRLGYPVWVARLTCSQLLEDWLLRRTRLPPRHHRSQCRMASLIFQATPELPCRRMLLRHHRRHNQRRSESGQNRPAQQQQWYCLYHKWHHEWRALAVRMAMAGKVVLAARRSSHIRRAPGRLLTKCVCPPLLRPQVAPDLQLRAAGHAQLSSQTSWTNRPGVCHRPGLLP